MDLISCGKGKGKEIIQSPLCLNVRYLRSSFFLSYILTFQLLLFSTKDHLGCAMLSACLVCKFRAISPGGEEKKSTDKIFYSIYNKCKEINTNKTWL